MATANKGTSPKPKKKAKAKGKKPKPKVHIEKDTAGKTKPSDVKTGATYEVHIAVPQLAVERLYHDNMPVEGAPFELELENGQIVKGNLDKNGRAKVMNIPSPGKRIKFGPDVRDYMAKALPANPDEGDYGEAEALASAAKAGQDPNPNKQGIVGDAIDWVWGTIQGNFNDKQTTSQIIVDAVISAIPIVGEVSDVRDLVAITIGMVQDEKKREDKWEWIGLVVVLLSLIPVVGGAIKGVGKLLARAIKNGGNLAKAINAFIHALNRLGWGDAVKWFNKLNLEDYIPTALAHYRKIMQHVDQALNAIKKVPQIVVPDKVLQMVERLKKGVDFLKVKAEAAIPDALKALNKKLKEVQQQIYEGEWVPIPKADSPKPTVLTRESESKLVVDPDTGLQKLVWEDPPFPANSPTSFQPVPEWPNLKDAKFTRKDAPSWAIRSFSGPLKAVRLPPGSKIVRVIEPGGGKTGFYWLHKLPESGESWRKECAVLDRWSENGKYVEMTVPEPGLVAWEGKISSQIDDRAIHLGKENKGYDQKLPGGNTQLLIDFEHPSNLHGLDVAKNLPEQPTGWDRSAMTGINFPKQSGVVEQKLGEFQIEEKGLVEPFATVQSAGDKATKAKSISDSLGNKKGEE